MAFLCRPYTVVALFPVLLAFAILHLFRNRWCGIQSFIVVAVVVSLLFGFFLFYNRLTTGSPLVTGYQVGRDTEQFSLEWNMDNGVVNSATNLAGLQLLLFAWPVPALFMVWWLFVSKRAREWDYLLLFLAVSCVMAYFIYGFQDLCYGPRFFYSTCLCWVVLSARGIASLAERPSHEPLRLHPLIIPLLLLCYGANVLRIAPNMKGYWQASPEQTVRRVREAGVKNGLVLVNRWDNLPITLNDLMFQGPLVYALNGGRRNFFLLHWYPERDFYSAEREGLIPLRILSQAEPGERVNSQLMAERLCDPASAYTRVDKELDEEIMNRIVFLEKSPFLWSDLVLGESDEIFIMDFWGRIYLCMEERMRVVNPTPFKGESKPLVACSFCLTPDGDGFVILDHRGGLYRVDRVTGQIEVLSLPADEMLASQIESTQGAGLLVLREDGAVLGWSPDAGFVEVFPSPGTKNVDYRMCVIDKGRGVMVMDGYGALYPRGTAQKMTHVSCEQTWEWEAARAIRLLERRPGAFVTMDAYGGIYERGSSSRPPFQEGLPYNKSWEYSVDLEVGQDGRTLYVLDRSGEIWKSHQ